MIIDLSKRREDYFELPSDTEILRRFIEVGEGKNITIRRIQELDRAGKVVVGTAEGNLSRLMGEMQRGETPELDYQQLMQQYEELGPDELMVLPPFFHLERLSARQHLVYSAHSLMNLDGAAVSRKLGLTKRNGGDLKSGQVPDYALQEGGISHIDRCLALNEVQRENLEESLSQVLLSHSWWGKDRRRRVSPLYANVEGAEGNAFQNIASWKVMMPVWRRCLERGTDEKGKRLSDEQRTKLGRKLSQYQGYIDKMRLQPHLDRLRVSRRDLTYPMVRGEEYTGKLTTPQKNGTWEMHVRGLRPNPQTGKLAEYAIQFQGIPVTAHGSPLGHSMVRGVDMDHVCLNRIFTSQRRPKKQGKGNPERIFCHHAHQGLLAIYTLRKGSDPRVPEVPSLLPTRANMDFVEKLRHGTIVLQYKDETDTFSRTALNHTSMGNLLVKSDIVNGFGTNWTDVGGWRPRGEDPFQNLIQFR